MKSVFFVLNYTFKTLRCILFPVVFHILHDEDLHMMTVLSKHLILRVSVLCWVYVYPRVIYTYLCFYLSILLFVIMVYVTLLPLSLSLKHHSKLMGHSTFLISPFNFRC